MTTQLNYEIAGVDIQKADAFVERIKKLVPSTHGPEVIQGIGGFAALYRLDKDRLLASCTDGVGTKLKLAQLNRHHFGVGVDLVAMCVNDLLCVGARPLFFLDYMAFGKLNTQVSEELIAGMVEGCRQSGMALIGGETAEMPGFYGEDEYDLAGFSVGEVFEKDLFSDKNIQEGDVLIGIASSGFHSNGYSLLRKWVGEDEKDLISELLTPTKIYVSLVSQIRQRYPQAILSMAHITGGGIDNIPRMSDKFDYSIDAWPDLEQVAPIFKKIFARQDLSRVDLFQTFNMGVGLVLLVKKSQAPAVMEYLASAQEKAWVLGSVKSGEGLVDFRD